MPVFTHTLVAALREMQGVAAVRTLPVAVYAVLGRQVRGYCGVFLAVGLSVTAFAVAKSHLLPLGVLLLSYSYFAVLTCAAPFVSKQYGLGRLTAGAVFAWSAVGYFVAPALFLGPGGHSVLVLALSWDMMLSCHSYCLDTARSDVRPSLGQCLHFVLINPCLVYAEKGTVVERPRANVPGLARACVGLLALGFATAILLPAQASLRQLAASATVHSPWRVVAAQALACGALRFVAQYARQAGLASLQIGILRQLGHVVPERYVAPFRAADPVDFFRRWNTYVGHWLQRYVFWPLSLTMGRSGKRLAYRPAASAAALLATFLACGLLHEAALYAAAVAPPGPMLRAFATAGALVVSWLGLARVWEVLQRRLPSLSRLTPFVRAGSRIALWTAIATVFFLWFA
jgi:hypothetical protein